MPWTAKAQPLVDAQYTPVGEAATAGLEAAREALERTIARGIDARDLLEDVRRRAEAARGYVTSLARYVRPSSTIADVSVAPFHLLATEGVVHDDRDHAWHMQALAEVCSADSGVLKATQWLDVSLADEAQVASAVSWWNELTERGGEGIVVKPFNFVTALDRSLVQSALKVRGPEYLRIVYGPEYSLPQHLSRLRERGLATKRRLALQEFTLGLEALHRFVERAPLRSVHECVFGVLALESEPVDARL